MGTPAYMAPEQREGKPADTRSDIYSFGCVLHEMLTGARAASQRKRSPSRELERIVSRCLEEDPGRRWQSATELERENRTDSRRSKPWKIVAAATAILALDRRRVFLLCPRPETHRQGHYCPGRFRQQHGRSCLRRHASPGPGDPTGTIAVSQIMDDEQMQRVIRRMSLSPGARITNPVAHEICVREGAAAPSTARSRVWGKAMPLRSRQSLVRTAQRSPGADPSRR